MVSKIKVKIMVGIMLRTKIISTIFVTRGLIDPVTTFFHIQLNDHFP